MFRQETNFSSKAPTFLKRSPTIPRAEILWKYKLILELNHDINEGLNAKGFEDYSFQFSENTNHLNVNTRKI